ncbi:caspase family protein [Mesorhizobium sp. WSM4904]|uniref:caspase family protein n=1 Tax=Mesorhizobium sp. WSM4904 TaxID=3038545 RepID=UPI0024184CA6|nr:caspase family protein [Mesorhizobium sp. WSM4904]WFP64062.1 caspase family protein [Mesorhizobium sp. WSM4904]
MRFWAAIVGLFFLAAADLLQADALAAGSNRVALVIGNSKYVYAPTLPNPAGDARLMADVLRKAGFNVIEGVDLDYAGMRDRLNKFTEASYDADTALIYYAGHGMQVNGKNYLIPIDAELTAPAHLKTRTIQMDELLAALPPDPAVGIVILDACRDNPLARTLAASLPKSRSTTAPGLAPIDVSGSEVGSGGVLIAFATDPGAVSYDGNGANSPYTMSLARHLAEPGVEIQSALTRVRGEVTAETDGRQRPWHNASLGREVFIGPQTPPPAAAAPQPSATETPAEPPNSDARGWEIEQRVWDEASKRNTLAHYEAYLQQFPNGAFADLARLNINQLKKPPITVGNTPAADAKTEGDAARSAAAAQPPAAAANPETDAGTEPTESAIGLGRQDRIDLQERLLAIGYDLDEADGDFGSKTRQAIGRWQEENRLPATTYLTQKQYARLKLDTDDALKNYRAQKASEAEAKKQEGATSQKAQKPQPVVRAKPRREQQREAANPRPALKSKPAQRKSGYRTCSGIDGTFEVPASQRCPLSGYAHY